MRSELAARILCLLEAHERPVDDEVDGDASPAPAVRAVHLARIEAAVAASRPVEMVLPAFPAKSPNPEKTIGPGADLGELLALQTLDGLCRQIGELHAPGATLTICADGRVFSDLVLVSDDDVDLYKAGVRQLLADYGLERLRVFHLEDVYGAIPYDTMRERLVRDYAEPRASLERRVRSETDARRLYNGIHRFVTEDRVVLRAGATKSAVRREARDVAYEVIRRSNAWSRLVAERFGGAVRLSIHPQPRHSDKLGIKLVPTRDAWATPWHGSMLYDGRSFRLVKRREAEALAARLAHFDGRYPYYTMEVAR